MANKLANTTKISRDEWLALRQQGIGGSDIATLLGLNKYKSRLQLYMEKIGEWEAPDTDNKYMKWGRNLEPLVADEFSEMNPDYKVKRNNFVLQHKDYPFMLANVDREIIHPQKGKGILEIKTTSQWNSHQWDSDKVPDAYMLQLQYYLLVTGAKYGALAVLIGGNEYKDFFIERDEELIEIIKHEVVQFWHQVENRIAPEVDGSEASTDFLNSMYGTADSTLEAIELQPEAEILIDQLEAIKGQIKALEDDKKEAENKLKAMLGEVTAGRVGSTTVLWQPRSRTSVDSKILAEKYPDIYKEVTKTTTFRQLSFKR